MHTLVYTIILFGFFTNCMSPAQGDNKTALFPGQSGQQNSMNIMGPRYSLEDLQEDLENLRFILFYELPLKPFADMDEVKRLFKTQPQLLHNNISELEFFRVINPIIIALHCGHSQLGLSTEYRNFLNKEGRYLPLAIKVISGRIYVYHGLGTNIPRGSEILSINGKSSQAILNTLLNNTVSDGSNLTNKYSRINKYFQDYYFEFIDSAISFDIAYLPPNTNQSQHSIFAAITINQLNTMWQQYLPARPKNKAMYFSKFYPDYAILTAKTFALWDNGTIQKYKDFIDHFFKDLSSRKVPNLILDLRNNGGGNSNCSSFLYSFLISEASPYLSTKSTFQENRLMEPIQPNMNHFTGNLYILINGGSFSNTGLLNSLLKYHHIGTFIGEETGGSYMCGMSGKSEFVLEHTGIRLPNNPYIMVTPASGLAFGRGIFPDYPVLPTLDDYLQGRDAEKEFAIDLIKRNLKGLGIKKE